MRAHLPAWVARVEAGEGGHVQTFDARSAQQPRAHGRPAGGAQAPDCSSDAALAVALAAVEDGRAAAAARLRTPVVVVAGEP